MTRALVAARLSRTTDDPSRIERDDAAAEKWANAQSDVEVVAVSTDSGVSGATSPFARPSLGPWLDPDQPFIHTYDEIVASSLDRLGRSARDLQQLRNWAEDNGKTIRVLKPELIWPVPVGVAGAASRIVWEVLGALAEVELELIKERYAAARAELRANGAFAGKPPFGFEVVGERYNKRLQLRAELASILREMVDRALRGDTYTSIAEWLDESGVSTVHGGPWSQTSVRTVLASPALKGRYLNADGAVTHRFDGLMTSAEWTLLQASLDRRPQRRGMITADTAMLTGVIFCDRCKGPMYRTKSKRTRKDGTIRTWFYYRCGGRDRRRSDCKNMVRLEDVDAWLHAWFTENGRFAGTEIVETITVPGDDHAEEIAELEADIRDLDLDAQDYDERHSALRSERGRLRSLPSEPAQVIERPTGRIVGDVWASLDDQQRRALLLAAGVKVYCRSNATLRAQSGGGRQNPTGPAGLILRDRMVIPRPESWGEPTEREVIYVTGDPARIDGALASLTEDQQP